MGANYHSSWSTATLFKAADMNAPLETIDKAITLSRSAVVTCAGNIKWNGVTGVLSWDAPLRVVFADDIDGKMVTNQVSSGSLTLATGKIAYVNVNSSDGATVVATSVDFSTASTALLPSSLIVLGMVNATKLEFYPHHLVPGLGAILSGEASVSCSAANTVNFDASPTIHMTLTTNSSLTLAGGANGKEYRLRITQDGTGNWAVTWDSSVEILWQGGSSPTISTAAGHSDWVSLYRSASVWYGSVQQDFSS